MNMKSFFAIAAVAFALTIGVCSAQAQQTDTQTAYRNAIQLAALWGNRVLAANPQTDQQWADADKQAWGQVTADASFKSLDERQQAKVRGVFEAAAVGYVFPKAVVDQALNQPQQRQNQTQVQTQTQNYPVQQRQQTPQYRPYNPPGTVVSQPYRPYRPY